jgi:hypothetical protein
MRKGFLICEEMHKYIVIYDEAFRPGIKEIHTLIKKKIEYFLIYREIQKGDVAKSCMRKGFLIYEEMRKYIVIYE